MFEKSTCVRRLVKQMMYLSGHPTNRLFHARHLFLKTPPSFGFMKGTGLYSQTYILKKPHKTSYFYIPSLGMYVSSLGIYIPNLGTKLSPLRKNLFATVLQQHLCSLTINVEQTLLSAENGQKKARSEMLNQVQHDKKVIDTRHVIPNSFRDLSTENVRKRLAVRC